MTEVGYDRRVDALRPRFELTVPFAPAEVFVRLDAQLACAGCPCGAVVVTRTIGAVDRRVIDVTIKPHLRHVWSPYLTLEVEGAPEGARLFGLFGPSPSVWTAVLAAYAALGILALFGGMLGLAQLGLGMTPWGLAAVPAAALLALLPYLAAQVGQARAREQMHLLRRFLQAALGLPGWPTAPLGPACPAPAPASASASIADGRRP